ncbi:MAG: 16S rRNA (guanine(966)-N(2))-methyltransferase RsmD [Steroidobacteraceae bacterium]|jgi:16S rRNA (guanine966-N2)-methyltransferase
MANSNEVRIIAGQWRGRKIRFPAGTAIRPTPDRVRETLFNWLAPMIRGARVLDAFAGSGALGLESASRGAASVVCLETDGRCVTALQERCREWGAAQVDIVRADALRWLAATRPSASEPFDLVFLDPPFDADLWLRVANRLEAGDWLSSGAYVYLELPVERELAGLPPNWKPWRKGRAGEVGYHLLRRQLEGGEPS